MTEFAVAGVGVWSKHFSSWEEFCTVLAGGAGPESSVLKPETIPANERRRAPLSVKMAVEVMDQACRSAGLDPAGLATVFASVYGDIQITDYMCRTLASAPRTVSPTKFHNSVHNASTGYWSMATQAHGPANAISAYSCSASMALLEGAIQAVEEGIPVLVAMQEMASLTAFKPIYDTEEALSTALVLVPSGFCASAFATVRLRASGVSRNFPDLPATSGIDWSDNFAAKMLPFLQVLATPGEARLHMPLSAHSSMSLDVTVHGAAGQARV
jgi:hypothetical protein